MIVKENDMNAWDHATSLVEKHMGQGGLFVRLSNNNDKIVGAFCGEPYSREVVWTGERYETYDASIHRDKKPSLRVMMSFYVPAEDDMKVIEGGTAWFRDLVKVREKYGLERWLFEVERHGEARDPKTKYTILPEEKIDASMQARIEEAGLHDLAALVGDEEESQARAMDPAAVEALISRSPQARASEAIEPQAAVDLVSRLKQLSRPDIEHFLTDLGVRRVRDLRADDLPRALARLDELEQPEMPSYSDDFDPFA